MQPEIKTSVKVLSGLTASIYQQFATLKTDDHFYEQHYLRIARYVARGETIECILPAFPAKTANRNKAIGKTADLAEYLGLKKLNDFAEQINAVYAPGCKVHICSDGRVFAGLVGIEDEDVNIYSDSVRAIVKKAGFTNLSFFNLEDIFVSRDFAAIRAQLDQEHAEPLAILKQRVKQSAEAQYLFNGIHRFLFEDYLTIWPDRSRNTVRKQTKELAYKVVQRSNSWSRLVESLFPDAIRLSIHPQLKAGAKFPVSLVPSVNRWRTPWHSVVIHDGNAYSLSTVAAAREQGGKLMQGVHGLPFIAVAGRLQC